MTVIWLSRGLPVPQSERMRSRLGEGIVFGQPARAGWQNMTGPSRKYTDKLGYWRPEIGYWTYKCWFSLWFFSSSKGITFRTFCATKVDVPEESFGLSLLHWMTYVVYQAQDIFKCFKFKQIWRRYLNKPIYSLYIDISWLEVMYM